MRRVVAVAVVAALASATPAFAADSVLASGTRLAQAAARPADRTGADRAPAARLADGRAAAAQDPATGLGSGGMSKGKKIAIGIGLAAAFAAIVYKIDHSVEDNTLSTRGLR